MPAVAPQHFQPQVPNRHTQPEAAGRTLGEMTLRLKAAGAEVLAMPCNTAHAHAAAIRAAWSSDCALISAHVAT